MGRYFCFDFFFKLLSSVGCLSPLRTPVGWTDFHHLAKADQPQRAVAPCRPLGVARSTSVSMGEET